MKTLSSTDLGLMTLVKHQNARLEDTPEFSPTLEGPSNLEPVGNDDNRGIFEHSKKLFGSTLLLMTIVTLLYLQHHKTKI